MKQLFQNLKTGDVSLIDVPAPMAKPGHLVIQTRKSVVSPGTERMLSDFGRAGWLGKARQQPDKVRQVVDKIKTDGLKAAVTSVFNKLDEPLPLGYSNVGVVAAVGEGVTRYAVGDLVVSNGAHAEAVSVPENLCAKVPDGVDEESAGFTVLGAIALNGVRLLEADIGSRVAVIGLGLVGLLSVQILKAGGCQVIGFDFDSARVDVARRLGAEAYGLGEDFDPVSAGVAFSEGAGVDGVIIAASTSSNEPIHQAARMCRKRGKVVLVGVVGLEISRGDFYEKEISFQVACSYGPGRYEANYEKKGLDYPIGFVRWTEQRNFQAVLQLMKDRKIVTEDLVTARLPFDEVEEKYTALLEDRAQLGIVLHYAEYEGVLSRTISRPRKETRPDKPIIGIIGAGSFARAVLMPALRELGADLKAVSTAGGSSSAKISAKFDVAYSTTDHAQILADPSISAVIIATRHDLHAGLAVEALEAGKHVFVEKPLALTLEQLEKVGAAYEKASNLVLAVGFNRRFSPYAAKMQSLLAGRQSPLNAVMVVNAGELPTGSWAADQEESGGRILGEGCHFIDLLRFLVGHPISEIHSSLDKSGQSAAITICFNDGSIGTINYISHGHRSFPKERLELFFDRKVLTLDNWRRLEGCGFSSFKKFALGRQDKGHQRELRSFLDAVQGQAPFGISPEEIFEVSEVAIAAAAIL